MMGGSLVVAVGPHWGWWKLEVMVTTLRHVEDAIHTRITKKLDCLALKTKKSLASVWGDGHLSVLLISHSREGLILQTSTSPRAGRHHWEP